MMSDQVREVLRSFGVDAAHLEQLGGALWRVRTSQSELALRALPRSSRKAAVSLAALELLSASGTPHLPAWRRTAQGQLGVRHEHLTWLLSDWVPGHGATLGLTSDAVVTAQGLARLHQGAHGLAAWAEDDRDPHQRFEGRCRSRLKAMHTYILIAENRLRPTATDRVFLSLVTEAIDQASDVIGDLDDADQRELSAAAHAAGAFVYRRTGEGGVIISAGTEPRAVFVDWSGCRRDLHLFDLGKLLGRVIKGSGGDEDVFGRTLLAYDKVRPLAPAEVRLLTASLSFPDEFYAVARRYYENKRDWTERSFARRLKRAADRVSACRACAGQIGELLRS